MKHRRQHSTERYVEFRFGESRIAVRLGQRHQNILKTIDGYRRKQKSSTQEHDAQYNGPDSLEGRPPQAGTSG